MTALERAAKLTAGPEYSPHTACQHYAYHGYAHLQSLIPPEQYADGEFTYPSDDMEDDLPGAQARWIDRAIMEMLRGKSIPPKKGRKGKDADPDNSPVEESAERAVDLAGVRIDWHRGLPELKVWAGRATMQTIVDGRRAALHAAGDLPMGTRLLDWTIPYKTMSGLDARTAASALDIGFSPDALGMMIGTYVAAELLMIVGLQLHPVTRFGKREYGYQDLDGRWWGYSVVDREGYHRMLTMSQPRR